MIKALFLAALILSASVVVAEDPKAFTELQVLSGTLEKRAKSEFNYTLKLDGMTGAMSVNGDALKDFKEGDRILVKGVIKTQLWNPKPDGTPQQQPVHWVIFMEVREAKTITTPFGL